MIVTVQSTGVSPADVIAVARSGAGSAYTTAGGSAFTAGTSTFTSTPDGSAFSSAADGPGSAFTSAADGPGAAFTTRTARPR
ncbi:hypothetical protein [Actinoplanes philippinensis]|uniref:hypothetical protein n=1 Tax=Actinoplanes philippinensis TaxID=35752 RepID=UPI0033F30F8D